MFIDRGKDEIKVDYLIQQAKRGLYIKGVKYVKNISKYVKEYTDSFKILKKSIDDKRLEIIKLENKIAMGNISEKELQDLEKFKKELQDLEQNFSNETNPYIINYGGDSNLDVKPYRDLFMSYFIDNLHSKIESFIADKFNVSEKQLQRYNVKKRYSENNDYFKLEAKLLKTDADTIQNLVITKATQWEQELDKYIKRLEAIRVAMSNLDMTDDKFIEIINKIKDLQNISTDKKVENLFKGI